MSPETSTPIWRQHVDLEQTQLALLELEPLLRAIAETGLSFIIKVDGGRTEGANPPVFTAVVSGTAHHAASIRCDDSDLVRAVAKAISAVDTALAP
jgi:hypothetical protein